MTGLFRKQILPNGLKISFSDESNRYFGDYHRVCVVASIHCELRELPATGPDEVVLLRDACEIIGDQLTIIRRFERMGVPSAAVENVLQALVDDFMHNTFAYLSRADYPYTLLKAELKRRGKQKFHV